MPICRKTSRLICLIAENVARSKRFFVPIGIETLVSADATTYDVNAICTWLLVPYYSKVVLTGPNNDVVTK